MITKNQDGSFTISADMILETTIGKREGGKTLQALSGEFPASGMEKFVRYGFQRAFNDKVGGSDTTIEEKIAEATAMIERFKTGNIGRVSAISVDPVTNELRAIIRKNLRAKKPAIWKEIRDLDARELNAKLDGILSQQTDERRAELTAIAEKTVKQKIADAKKQDAIELGAVEL